MLFNYFSKAGLAAMAVAFAATGLIAVTDASATVGPSRVDTLIVNVVGEAPLLNLTTKQDKLVLKNQTLSVDYNYQHADTIEFELVNQADASVSQTLSVDVSDNPVCGNETINFDLSQLPAGDYTVMAKSSGGNGYVEDAIAFSYSGETAILASANVSVETLAALEKKAELSDVKTVHASISETDRLITSVLLGTLTVTGSFFALKKFASKKTRSLVPDSAISFA